MSEEKVNLVAVSDNNLARTAGIRNQILDHLLKDGKVPDDKVDMEFLLKTVDGMDRTAVQIKRLQGDKEDRDISRQALEIAKKLEDSAILEHDPRVYDDEMESETLQLGMGVTIEHEDIELGNYEFNETELNGDNSGTDWESVEKQQVEKFEKAEAEKRNKV